MPKKSTQLSKMLMTVNDPLFKYKYWSIFFATLFSITSNQLMWWWSVLAALRTVSC